MSSVEAGANALGFIFHERSPRFVQPREIAPWLGKIPNAVLRVGVFVDRSPWEVEAICGDLGLDVAQLHGSEKVEDIPRSVRVWKAVRMSSVPQWPSPSFPAEAWLLDGPSSGQPFDWSIAPPAGRPIILAGGLNEVNVADAIRVAKPWGVDACSGLESVPGRKDRQRLTRFVQACQTALAVPQ